MLNLISFIFFLSLQTFLILSTNINIYPEFFFFPWLMSKGYLIHRDFGSQHGFMTYLILIPFALDKSLILMKFFYVTIQTINLVLVLLILKKSNSKLGIIIGGFLYVLLNFYISDNNLWDEVIVTSLFLLIYYLISFTDIKLTLKLLLSGFILGVASFMKPSFAIMLFPLIIVYRSLLPLIPIGFIWVFVMVFFAFNRGLYQFLDNYIFYNKYYALLPKGFFVEKDFFYRTLIIITISLVVYFFLQKKQKKSLYLTLLFMLFSALLFLPSFHKIHLPPFIAFFTLFISQLVGRLKKQHIIISLVVLSYYGFFIARKTKHQYFYLNNFRKPYIDNKIIYARLHELKSYPLVDKKLYIFANQIELYFLLDVLPPSYFTLVFPFVRSYYPSLESRIIQDIKNNKVEYVIFPKPRDENYVSFSNLKRYIVSHYNPEKDSIDIQIYKKR